MRIGGLRRWIALAAAALAAVQLLTAPSAFAAPSPARDGGLTWGEPTLVDPPHGFASISCVTRKVCRAGDVNSRIERWDGVHWTHGTSLPTAPSSAIKSMSCTSTEFCAAVQMLSADNGYYDDRFRPIVRRPDGRWNLSASAVPIPRPGYDYYIPDLSCAAANFCILVAFAKYQVWNGSSWSAPRTFARLGSFAEHVSCATASFCMAASSYGDVYRWNGRSWTDPMKLQGSGVITNIECATATSCTLLTNHGARRWNGSAWGPLQLFVHDDPNSFTDSLKDLSCPTATFCMAVTFDRDVFTFTAGSGWRGPHRVGHNSAPYVFAPQVSCSSADFCVVITDGGEAVHRLNGKWQTPRPGDLAIGGYPSISCDSPVLCLVVDAGGGAAAFNGSSWTTPRRVASPPPTFTDVSCVGSSFCVASGGGGQVRIRSHGQWSNGIVVRDEHGNAADRGLSAISCGTPTLCTAHAGPDGDVFRWDGSAWHVLFHGYSNDFATTVTAESCGLDGCVVHHWFHDWSGESDDMGTRVYHADGTTEDLPPSTGPVRELSCATVTFCMAESQVFDGQHWTDVPGGAPDFPPSPDSGRSGDLSCASPTFCVATQWKYVSTWNGARWSAPQTIIDPVHTPGFTGFRHVSCKRTICAVVDDFGRVVVAT